MEVFDLTDDADSGSEDDSHVLTSLMEMFPEAGRDRIQRVMQRIEEYVEVLLQLQEDPEEEEGIDIAREATPFANATQSESLVSQEPIMCDSVTPGDVQAPVSPWLDIDNDEHLAQALYEKELWGLQVQREQQVRDQKALQEKAEATKIAALQRVNAATARKKAGGIAAARMKKKTGKVVGNQLQQVRELQRQRWAEKAGRGAESESYQKGHSTINLKTFQQKKDAARKHDRMWRERRRAADGMRDLGKGPAGKAKTFDPDKRTWTLEEILERERNCGHMTKEAEAIGKAALILTNRFRAQQGLPALRWCDKLGSIGYGHSKRMGDEVVPFGHDGFKDRMRKFPYSCRSGGENVAMSSGLSDVAAVAVNGWINSPGHRRNMLGNFNYCGIGCYKNRSGAWYLTQLLSMAN